MSQFAQILQAYRDAWSRRQVFVGYSQATEL